MRNDAERDSSRRLASATAQLAHERADVEQPPEMRHMQGWNESQELLSWIRQRYGRLRHGAMKLEDRADRDDATDEAGTSQNSMHFAPS